jgi:hypothetical protein
VPYLYGDSTAFPLNDNFVETLRALSDMCVALLRVDEQLDETDAKAQEAKNACHKEQLRLEALAGTLLKALESHVGDPQAPDAQATAVRCLQAVQQILEGAKNALNGKRENALREVEVGGNELRRAVLKALEQFFAGHELPEMVWGLHWRGGIADGPTRAQTIGTAPSGLQVALEVDTHSSPLWRRAVRVDALERAINLHLPGEGGWLRRGPRMKETSLDHFFITEVHVAPERDAMVIRKSDRHASSGYEIVVRQEGHSLPSIRQVSEDGSHVEEAIQLDGVDATTVERLWARVETTMIDLVKKRTHVAGASLDGEAVEDIDRPARIAARLIQSVASVVAEMAKRSPSPRELVLKFEDPARPGHRDEVFVARDELLRKWKGLSMVRRGLFDSWNLGKASSKDVEAAAMDTLVEMEIEEPSGLKVIPEDGPTSVTAQRRP